MTQLTQSPTETAGSSPSEFTDEQLMQMIQSHRHRGLDILHDRYATLLKGLIVKSLRNYADAEDLLQEVFLEVWNRAANYNPMKGRPLPWIATLTRRRSIDRLRRHETYRRFEERYAEETKSHSDCWTHVHEDLAQIEMTAHLQRAMVTLPEVQRMAINLAYHHQMSQREIATHTGIPLGTIKTRLELGRRKMAASLSGFEDLLWAGNPRKSTQNGTSRTTAIREVSPITLWWN
jgi:RNA polymerase sigma-70 factor (ECF subfamily)